MIHKVEERVTIAAPPERVLAVLTDFEAYPSWQSEIHSAEILERDEQGRPARVTLNMASMGMKAHNELEIEYLDNGVQWRLVAGELFKMNDARYVLTGNPNGGTDVESETLIALKWHGIPQPLVGRMFKKNVGDALRTIKRLAEAA